MSVAQEHQALDVALTGLPDDDAWEPVDAPAAPVTALRRPARSALPPRPPQPSPPAAWVQALRVRTLPTALVGAAVGGLAVAGEGGTRPGLLAAAVALLVVATAVAGLLRDLGDARPRQAGPLRRVEAGRAVLGLGAVGTALLGTLVVVRGPLGLALAAAGVVALLLALSRRSGAVASAVGGLLAGGVAAATVQWAATGAVDLAVAALAGAPVAGLLAARRAEVGPGAARAVALLPYAGAGAALALHAVALPVLAVGLALPAARRAASATGDAAPVVAGHARLFAVLLVGSLLAAALLGL